MAGLKGAQGSGYEGHCGFEAADVMESLLLAATPFDIIVACLVFDFEWIACGSEVSVNETYESFWAGVINILCVSSSFALSYFK